MYYLKKNPLLKASYEACAQVREQLQETLADATAGLTFEPQEHRYFLGNKEMRSVSSVVEHFVPFDMEATARRTAVNPRHPLFGKSPEEIMAIWQQAGKEAADSGTLVHAFGEACYLYMLDREEEIEEEFRARITPDGLAALSPKEESVARWWNDMDWQRYAPIAKETRLVNPALGYAGTLDLLLWDLYNYTLALKDYKTNKDLDRWFGDMCIAPLTMIKSNDIGKYTIQQTLYTIALRMYGLTVSTNSLIWLKEDSYEERQLQMIYDKVIYYAVAEYMNSLNVKI